VRFVRTRDAFMTNVSEQMLKPVQALEELAAQLKNTSHLEGDDPELLRSHLRSVSKDASSVQRYSAYLGHVLKDLLLLIRAQERIKPSRENVLDVAEQIRAVVQDEQDRADQAHVTLRWRCDRPLTIHGDGQQIRVALAKLVENAISYSPSGSTVSLVAQASKDGNYGIIRVVDHGRGISKTDQDRIFERFYRADNQNEETAVGIGLGLAIVKHVALTHHGSVTVWSAPGEGSTFTLMLPLAQGPVAGQGDDNPSD
ncbi:MAG: HAMP domain-containing histidine kinase, partial [Bifidobacterium sp.]|nr:HAMP domain-containing histidine kinase [Bifidobacterium sp.]